MDELYFLKRDIKGSEYGKYDISDLVYYINSLIKIIEELNERIEKLEEKDMEDDFE